MSALSSPITCIKKAERGDVLQSELNRSECKKIDETIQIKTDTITIPVQHTYTYTHTHTHTHTFMHINAIADLLDAHEVPCGGRRCNATKHGELIDLGDFWEFKS